MCSSPMLEPAQGCTHGPPVAATKAALTSQEWGQAPILLGVGEVEENFSTVLKNYERRVLC